MSHPHQFRIVVLISGNGSNLQAIIDETERGRLPVRICAVVSNRPGVYGLERAEQHGIPNQIVDHRHYSSREDFDQELARVIDQYEPDLIVLAGFMRILTEGFVNRYLGKMINIHPSLLPRFQGLDTHRRVLEDNQTQHGATVHYVVPQLDSGPIILQASLEVYDDDTPESLEQRVHQLEYMIYPESIRRIALGQVRFSQGTVYYNDKPATDIEKQYRYVESF